MLANSSMIVLIRRRIGTPHYSPPAILIALCPRTREVRCLRLEFLDDALGKFLVFASEIATLAFPAAAGHSQFEQAWTGFSQNGTP